MTTVEMTRHVADETLAAFADGRLGSPEQVEVINHLSSCDECRDLFDLIGAAQQEGVIESTKVVRPVFGRPSTFIGVAAAAAVAVVLLTPTSRNWIEEKRTGGASTLIAAAKTLDERTVEARLVGFPYKKLKATTRGDDDDQVDPEGDLAGASVKGAAYQILDQKSTSPRVLRAKGLSYLILGEYDAAIANLRTAVEKTGEKNAVMLNDLAGAYLQHYKRMGDPASAQNGLQAAEKSLAIEKTPEAMWNRALALDDLHRTADAIRAWQDYIALDPQSPWAAEAKDNIADLNSPY